MVPYQMGSNMKKSIFDEQTSKALKKWHMKAQKKKNNTEDHRMEPTTQTLGSPVESPADSPAHAHPPDHINNNNGNINGLPFGKPDLLTDP